MSFIVKEVGKLQENIILTTIGITELDRDVTEKLDANFVKICKGNSDWDLMTVKKEVANLYKMKDFRWRMGATAEFFVHLYMQQKDFKQQCIFENLEERSIKKGFDGVYSKDNDVWLMESKSGSIETERICHSNKILDAIDDLEKKISGKTRNDPWRNAFLHASVVTAPKTILNRFDRLSHDFVNEKFHSINEFNTMPCATIFLSGAWPSKNHNEITLEISKILDRLKGNNIHIVCTTHKSVDLFLQYIDYPS